MATKLCLFFSIWYSQIGEHQEENLAKFGYKPDMRVEKIKNFLMFFLPARTCCKNLVFPPPHNSGELGSFKKRMCQKLLFFSSEKWENLPLDKTLMQTFLWQKIFDSFCHLVLWKISFFFSFLAINIQNNFWHI